MFSRLLAIKKNHTVNYSSSWNHFSKFILQDAFDECKVKLLIFLLFEYPKRILKKIIWRLSLQENTSTICHSLYLCFLKKLLKFYFITDNTILVNLSFKLVKKINYSSEPRRFNQGIWWERTQDSQLFVIHNEYSVLCR